VQEAAVASPFAVSHSQVLKAKWLAIVG
jgi:hypothetical protein